MNLNPNTATQVTRDICGMAPIMPVLVVKNVASAIPLAKALIAGGLPALEVTMRTPAALEVIQAMSKLPGGIVGAGTLVTPQDVRDAKAAGAVFGVSPGATDVLIEACIKEDLPLLPGSATASEAMRLLERGYSVQKFFPAEASGGAPALKAIGGPLPQISFCPTGGVSLKNAPSYLKLSNVICAGGSWIAPEALVAGKRWDDIEALAREAKQTLVL